MAEVGAEQDYSYKIEDLEPEIGKSLIAGGSWGFMVGYCLSQRTGDEIKKERLEKVTHEPVPGTVRIISALSAGYVGVFE